MVDPVEQVNKFAWSALEVVDHDEDLDHLLFAPIEDLVLDGRGENDLDLAFVEEGGFEVADLSARMGITQNQIVLIHLVEVELIFLLR